MIVVAAPVPRGVDGAPRHNEPNGRGQPLPHPNRPHQFT